MLAPLRNKSWPLKVIRLVCEPTVIAQRVELTRVQITNLMIRFLFPANIFKDFIGIWNPVSGFYHPNRDETYPTILSSICDGFVFRLLQACGCDRPKEQGRLRA